MINSIDSGKKTSITVCESISVDELISEYNERFKEVFIKAKLNISGFDVQLTSSKTGFKGDRLWFSCPICKERKGKIYKHPLEQVIGCRECLNLEYESRL